MENIDLLLQYMEVLLSEGKKDKKESKVTINLAEMQDLIGRARASFKELIGLNLIDEAKVYAKDIIDSASAKRAQLLNNQIIITEAEAIAEKKKRDAQNFCNEQYNELKNNSIAIYKEVSNNLESFQEYIDKQIANIEKSH